MMERFQIVQGDITKWDVDAIVNAANPALLGGGGVDGAIHAAAGPELLEACRKLHGCERGEAKMTKGFLLPARYVIHTPGPVYQGGHQGEEEILASCYRNSLRLAADHKLESVAFPSISTGIYGYPVALAAQVAIREILTFLNTQSTVKRVTMVCFDERTKEAYEEAAQTIRQSEFVIGKAKEEDLSQMQELMKTIVKHMEVSEWFYEGESEFLADCLNKDRKSQFAVTARTREGILAGFFLVEIPGLAEDHLGYDLGFTEEQLLASAHMDTAVVDPLYRGYGLQGKMMEFCEEELEKQGMQYLLATVHPENPYSLHNLQKRGYEIRKTKKKYGGSMRHILCKVLKEEEKKKEGK